MTPEDAAEGLASDEVARLASVLAEEVQVAIVNARRQEQAHPTRVRISEVVVRLGQDRDGSGLAEHGWQVELRIDLAAAAALAPWAPGVPLPVDRIRSLPVVAIGGVSGYWEGRLARAGIRTIGELADAQPLEVARRGRLALEHHTKARLIATDAPDAPAVRKDLSVDAAVILTDEELQAYFDGPLDVVAIRGFLLRLDLALDRAALSRLRLSDVWAGQGSD